MEKRLWMREGRMMALNCCSAFRPREGFKRASRSSAVMILILIFGVVDEIDEYE